MKNVCMWTENEKIVIIIKWLNIDDNNNTNVQSIDVLVLFLVGGMESVVHYELLEPGRTITADVYCQQLDRANEALRQKSCTLVDRIKVLFSSMAMPGYPLQNNPRKNKMDWMYGSPTSFIRIRFNTYRIWLVSIARTFHKW